MLIPIRCFSCGKVIANKWSAYERRLREMRSVDDENAVTELTCARDVPSRATAGQILDQLTITKLCCRRHFLATVDLMDTM